MIVGNVIGLGIIFAQYYFEFIPLNPDMYYLNSVPVLINKWHIVALNVGVIVISWAVLILPSHLAATISPAKTMRYE
jgi:lipoprotein-releasing system permease protein